MNSIKNVNVAVHVLESSVDIDRLTTFTLGSTAVGNLFSSQGEVVFNSVDDGYSILYDSETFNKLDMLLLAKNILVLLMKNLSNCRMNLTIYYHFRVYEDETDITGFNMETASNFISFHDVFSKVNDNNDQIFVEARKVLSYRISQSVLDTCEIYINICRVAKAKDEENRQKTITPQGNNNSHVMVEDYFRDITWMDDDNDRKSSKKKSKKKSKADMRRKEYPTSKVMKAAKSPKKSYKRHGVLVCKDKSAIKKDEKIIKDFIKDFFPGGAEWKKKFRKELLNRWMSTYVISVKGLKMVEKKMRNDAKETRNRRRRVYGVSKALDITSRLMTTPVDQWSDPRR